MNYMPRVPNELAWRYSETDQVAAAREQVDILRVNGFDHLLNGGWTGHMVALTLWCGMLAACLSRWDDAERHFADALAMNERLGARPYVVRTRRAWAAMLLDRGAPADAARARDLIAAGLAEAEALGMAREVVRLQRLQAALLNSRAGES